MTRPTERDRGAQLGTTAIRGLTACSLLCAAAMLGCSVEPRASDGAGAANPVAKPAAPRPTRTVPVQTWKIEPTPFRERLEVTGTIRPWTEAEVASEFGGTVHEVDFDKGERVERGRVLARIGDDIAAAQLAQAEADLMAASANFEKMSKLVERDAVPKQDFVAATARRDRQRAIVDEMRARLERAIVRAPLDGFVLDRSIEPGEVVPPGAHVTTLHRLDRLKIEAEVPDTEVSWLTVGRSAEIEVDAWPERRFPAVVRYVSPSADTDSRSFEVELSLDNPGLDLRPGMIARVALDRRVVEAGLAVPRDALVTRVDGLVAFVVENCRAVERRVRTEGSEGDRVLVADGLAVGERLVVEGQRDLADGQLVRAEGCP